MPRTFLSEENLNSLPDSPINLNERPQLKEIARILNTSGSQRYYVPDSWFLHLYEYYGEMTVNNVSFPIYPGCLTLIPPGTHFGYNLSGTGLHIYARFCLPEQPLESSLTLPIKFDIRGDLYRFEQKIIASGRNFIYRENQLHAEIQIWDLLWELANCGGKSVATRHPSVEKAMEIIEVRLSEDISITSLAREVGVSRNHLTRLFQSEKQTTVVRYVRQQRAQRAKRLLESTNMEISDIARQVHSPNLQSFSALVKKETGHPPTYWRRLS